MPADKDKQYNAIIWTSRQMSWPCLTRSQQLWPLDRRMRPEPHPWPMAYGWDENNIL